MPKFKNRNVLCDQNVENRFGSPDWSRSKFFKVGDKVVVYTPFLTGGFWRVDNYEDLVKESENGKTGQRS